MHLTITQATPANIPGIQALANMVFRQAMVADHDAAYIERFLQRVYSENSLKRTIENGSTTFLVATTPDTLVGMLQFGSPLFDDCEERKEIHKLYIHPDYTRQGIGGQLLTEMLRQLQATEIVREVFAYVKADDIARQQFYQKYQFGHIPTQDKHDEHYWLHYIANTD